MRRILTALLPMLLAAPTLQVPQAKAASSYDDLDAPSKKARKNKAKSLSDQEVREIVKGFYLKSNIGAWSYVGRFLGWVKPGTSLALAFGQDFVDKEHSSLAWEISFFQGIHNGTHYEEQSARAEEGPPYVEGDLRTYTLAGLVEWSTYPSRRLGLGIRAGGGVLYSPLLMEQTYYEQDVLNGEWGISDPGIHGTPHPLVALGPTLEYYTKLSHFSIGIDADVIYAFGFDLGISTTASLKYTF